MIPLFEPRLLGWLLARVEQSDYPADRSHIVSNSAIHSGETFCGVHLEAGTVVGINPVVIHYDQSIFGTDTAEFRPECWTESVEDKVKITDRHLMTVLRRTKWRGEWRHLGFQESMIFSVGCQSAMKKAAEYVLYSTTDVKTHDEKIYTNLQYGESG
ncbi:hypothetical protein TSTA_032230 [Talaromyces stipitatus ATCC 10500]|uniref:Uncharacterized protein n=1 Tax=Talaromyces stipitatus (strain ATCC 10500 / CBS 375.48 / QM 6759 / NRRL 1006) TaxID=441959 RepID=B8M805_TALSN|nr:uncharacterized protein TSTA_032230 [Talaromyces stipitatus ATCC 10500]EED19967.1 hypothetical protein TSTA_032230 [Talaromyces stipitatus ATCC 10500]